MQILFELTVIVIVHIAPPPPPPHRPWISGVTSAWQVCMANAIWSRPLFAMQKLIESIGSVREKVKYPAECVVEDVHWRGNPGVPLPLHNVWERMYTGGGNPGVPLPLHNVWERMYAGGGNPGVPYLCIMCGRGCTLEGGNPGVSLLLHNVWERMYAGGG